MKNWRLKLFYRCSVRGNPCKVASQDSRGLAFTLDLEDPGLKPCVVMKIPWAGLYQPHLYHRVVVKAKQQLESHTPASSTRSRGHSFPVHLPFPPHAPYSKNSPNTLTTQTQLGQLVQRLDVGLQSWTNWLLVNYKQHLHHSELALGAAMPAQAQDRIVLLSDTI